MNPWTHVVGWILIHFIWQGAVLAGAAAAALWFCRNRSANARYAVGCVALGAMLAAPLVSARVLLGSGTPLAVSAPARETAATPDVVASTLSSWTGGVAPVDEVWASVNAALPFIVFVWLAGVAGLLVRMAGGLWQVRRLQVRALAADPSPWQAAAERIAERVGLRVAVHVVESALVAVPSAVGWARPVILLPIAALANLTPSQVEAILAHELVHIRRRDYLVNLGQTVAETLLFFHPGVWWISARIRAEREHCCDDVAVQVCGNRVDYATALAELEAWRSCGTTLALAATHGSLSRRVGRILEAPVSHEERSASWVMTLALTLSSAVAIGAVHVSSLGRAAELPAGREQATEAVASPAAFGWQVRTTNHFEIHSYPALAPDLETIAATAERAYDRISSRLQYNLPFKVPLVVFKTRSDFAQQALVPDLADAIAKGEVKSFSEHRRNRIAMLLETEPDGLQSLMTHEVTHVFAFDIIPRSPAAARRVAPWIDEGFAEYMTDVWDPDHLRQIGNLVAAGNVPRMSTLTGGFDTLSVAILGHAAFDFIEAEYGSAAVWQFLVSVRRSVVDGAADLYQTAFNRTPEEFDAAFATYLQRRFPGAGRQG